MNDLNQKYENAREKVNQALDEIIRSLSDSSMPGHAIHGVSVSRDSRRNVRVSYRVTHFLVND